MHLAFTLLFNQCQRRTNFENSQVQCEWVKPFIRRASYQEIEIGCFFFTKRVSGLQISFVNIRANETKWKLFNGKFERGPTK